MFPHARMPQVFFEQYVLSSGEEIVAKVKEPKGEGKRGGDTLYVASARFKVRTQ